MRYFWCLGTVLVFLFTAGLAVGEIYQYTDENGVVRFTDDPSLIPEQKRKNAKVFDSIETKPERKKTVRQTTPVEKDTPAEGAKSRAKELEAVRSELNETYNALQEEKKALGDPPSQTATTKERKDYNQRVNELNEKIEDYQQRVQKFQEEVASYNRQLGTK